MEADASDHFQLDYYITFKRALGDPLMTTSTTKLLESGTHSIRD
jgi:hypothetical protein